MEGQEESIDYSICMACLCVGRTLKKITDKRLKQYYMDILNEMPLNIISQVLPVVCWECEAMMRKITAFKEQVQDSYRVLQTYTKENLNECLLSEVRRPSHLKIHKNENINALPDCTEELENVKAERDTGTSLHRDSSEDVFKTEVPDIVSVLCDSKKQHSRKSLLSGVRRQSRVKTVSGETGNTCDDVDRLEVKEEKNEDTRRNGSDCSGEMKGVPDVVSVLCDVKKQKRRKESKFKPEWNLDDLARDSYYDGRDAVAAESGGCGADDNDDTFPDSCYKSDSGGAAEDEKPTLKNKAESLITKMNKVGMKSSQKAIKSDIASLARAVELSYGEVRAERERRARAARYVRAPHRCRTCLLAFATPSAARAHQTDHHAPELGEYICPICYIIVATVESFTNHYDRHIKRYECNICQKRTEDVKTMRRHLHARHPAAVRRARALDTPKKQTMKGRRGGRVPCSDCDKTFSHRAGLMNHRLAMHETKSQYPCGECDKVFRWKTSLKRHLEKHQSKEAGGAASAVGVAYCVECDVRFSSACSLQRHLRNSLKHVTQDQLKFICEHCNKRFADKTKLRNHIEEKHLHWTYTCQICNKPSKNRVGLEQHIRNVHKGRPHNKVCHHCGKAFPTKVQLESHIRSHTGERPFICEFCPTTFSQQSNLYKHHRQVHQNIKSKRYPLCKKRRTEVQIVDPQQQEGLPVPSLLYYENILGV